MRVWFSGGPLDGLELDLDGEPPDELFLSLHSAPSSEGPRLPPSGDLAQVDHGRVATYRRREEGISNYPNHVGYREVK